MAQNANVEPDMATYCSLVDIQVLIRNLDLAQRIIYLVEFDRLNSTGVKNRFKMAQNANVEPDIATYCSLV